MNKRLLKTIFFLFLLSTFCFPLFSFSLLSVNIALAADDVSAIDITCARYDYPWCEETPKGFGALVGRFYTMALGLAGASALGVLIYGAILWTLSGAVTSKQDALQWIWGAVWGLILLMGAYLILNTISPDLVNLEEPELEEASLPLIEEESIIGSGGQVYQWAQIPMNKYCRDVLGEGWVTVDSSHCSGSRPGTGYDCCGYFPE